MRLTNLTQVRNIQHETEKSSQQIIRTAHQLHKVLFVTVSRPATSVDVADLTVFHYSTPSHSALVHNASYLRDSIRWFDLFSVSLAAAVY